MTNTQKTRSSQDNTHANYTVTGQMVTLAASYAATDRPLDELTMLDSLARDVATLTRQAVTEARAAGATWQEIGSKLGITRQAAQQNYGTPTPAPTVTAPCTDCGQPTTLIGSHWEHANGLMICDAKGRAITEARNQR